MNSSSTCSAARTFASLFRAIGTGCVAGSLYLSAPAIAAESVDDDEERPWVEAEFRLPPTSVIQRPLRIDLGPAADNIFAADATTIAVGDDGVIRFALQVVSASGAKTVTYEGIRCATRELRRYAAGRSDGSWLQLRADRWQRIEAKSINAYQNALFREYFCPGGVAVRSAAEAVSALERGGHPAAAQRP